MASEGGEEAEVEGREGHGGEGAGRGSERGGERRRVVGAPMRKTGEVDCRAEKKK